MNAQNTPTVSVPRKNLSAIRTGIRAGSTTHTKTTVPR